MNEDEKERNDSITLNMDEESDSDESTFSSLSDGTNHKFNKSPIQNNIIKKIEEEKIEIIDNHISKSLNDIIIDEIEDERKSIEWVNWIPINLSSYNSFETKYQTESRHWLGANFDMLFFINSGDPEYHAAYVGFDNPSNMRYNWRYKIRYEVFILSNISDEVDPVEILNDTHVFNNINLNSNRYDHGRGRSISNSTLFQDQEFQDKYYHTKEGSTFNGNDIKYLKVIIKLNCDNLSNMSVPNSYDSKLSTGMVGLENLGATCYLNALLQMLYHVNAFRMAVYNLPHQDEVFESSTTLALQSVFNNLQCSNKEVTTQDLTTSFGWSNAEAFMQQDVQEMMRVLLDKLEEKMKGTSVDGSIQRLFAGKIRSFIKCVNVEYESKREETFYDIQLDVKGCNSVYDSFKKYTEKEILDGENQYDAGEEFGKQDAQKGVIFTAFPPVLTIHLKRFDFDLQKMGFTKIHDKFEFPTRLCLDEFLCNDGNKESDVKSVPNKYLLHSVLVHSGDVGGGHYYAYIRPSDGYDYSQASKVNQSIELSNQNITLESMIGEYDTDTIADISSKGKWYKFNDESVIRVRSCEAIENCFGSNPRDRQFIGLGSAYMLVYIRESDADDVMKPIVNDDIPAHLKERLKKEITRRIQEEKRQAREKQYYDLNYYLEEDIANFHSYSQKMDFLSLNNSRNIRVMVDSSMLSILLQLSDLLNISPIRIRIWNIYYDKRSDHIRASERFEFNQDTISSKSRKYCNKDSLYIDILPDALPDDEMANQVFYRTYKLLRNQEKECLKNLHEELEIINGPDKDNDYLEGYGIGSSNIGLFKNFLLPISIKRHLSNDVIQVSSADLIMTSDIIIENKNDIYNEQLNVLTKEMNDLMIKHLPIVNETFKIFFKIFDPLNILPLKLWHPLISNPYESNKASNEYNPMKYLGSKLLSKETTTKSLQTVIRKMLTKVFETEEQKNYFKDSEILYNILDHPRGELTNIEISDNIALNVEFNLDGEQVIISQNFENINIDFNNYPNVVDSIRIFKLLSLEEWLNYRSTCKRMTIYPRKKLDEDIIRNRLIKANNKKLKLDNNNNNNLLGYKMNDVFEILDNDTDSLSFSITVSTDVEIDQFIHRLAYFLDVNPKNLLLWLDSDRMQCNYNAWYPLTVPVREVNKNNNDANNEITLKDAMVARKIKLTGNILHFGITPFDIYMPDEDNVDQYKLCLYQDRSLKIIIADNYTRLWRRKYILENYNLNINQIDNVFDAFDNDDNTSKKRSHLGIKDNDSNVNENKLDRNFDYTVGSIDNNDVEIIWPNSDSNLPIEFVNEKDVYVRCKKWCIPTNNMLLHHSDTIMRAIGLPINLNKNGHIFDTKTSGDNNDTISIYDDNKKNIVVDMSLDDNTVDSKITSDIVDINCETSTVISNVVNKKQIFRENILSNQDNIDKDNVALPPSYPFIIYHLTSGFINKIDTRSTTMNTLSVSWMEGFFPLNRCFELYLQHVTNEELDFMGGFVSNIKSMQVVVHNFTLLGSAVNFCGCEIFNPPFFTYIREDDDYESVVSRISNIMGENITKLRLAVVDQRVPFYLSKPMNASNQSTPVASSSSLSNIFNFSNTISNTNNSNSNILSSLSNSNDDTSSKNPSIWESFMDKFPDYQKFGSFNSYPECCYPILGIQRSVMSSTGNKTRRVSSSIKING